MSNEPESSGERDDIPIAPSPATSVSSLFSEQSEIRNSPFLSQSSPLSTSSVFQRPDFLSTNIPDSETSSRSSLDGMNLRDSTSEKIEKFRMRHNKRSPSQSPSDGEEEVDVVRKISTPISEEKFVGRGIDAPRGRIANIRRESNCSVDSEVAHERLVKVSQQVSTGFDDISIEPLPSVADYRRRTASFSTTLGEPISVVTNVFIPHSCSPSPTRLPDAFKQCYSPSTQQVIRPHISYSPSPKQSPSQSPTRHHKKFVRSVSPILLNNRSTLKRKLTAKEVEMDPKRALIHRNNTSPLVNNDRFPYPSSVHSNESASGFASPSVPHSPCAIDFNRSLSGPSGDCDSDDNNSFNKEEKMDVTPTVSVTNTPKKPDVDMNNAKELIEASMAAPLPENDDF
ncbi:unnamed protein product [Caenorhabditis angaria]|uniref:Uncharacterized protein n=1 Tax=Caenorhabditis angaria TaxID=860376 RepID=A0A9P1J0W4_9PELO|nr:unnamed protein product [Caenorhabditis angaria]